MPVENGEKGTLRPAIAFLLRRLLHIEHDRDPVLVVVSNNALVCVRSIGFDDAVFFDRVLGLLKIWQLNM